MGKNKRNYGWLLILFIVSVAILSASCGAQHRSIQLEPQYVVVNNQIIILR
jgi:hypothetical protein